MRNVSKVILLFFNTLAAGREFTYILRVHFCKYRLFSKDYKDLSSWNLFCYTSFWLNKNIQSWLNQFFWSCSRSHEYLENKLGDIVTVQSIARVTLSGLVLSDSSFFSLNLAFLDSLWRHLKHHTNLCWIRVIKVFDAREIKACNYQLIAQEWGENLVFLDP